MMKHASSPWPLVLLAIFFLGPGCIREGTLVTWQTERLSHTRATDQAVISEAIDMAFGAVDTSALSEPLLTLASRTAYVEVTAPFPLDPAIRDYLRDQAAAVVGLLGLQILEVRQTLERPNPERTLEVVETRYPDVSARVLVMVSSVGVDEILTGDEQDSHGSVEPERVLVGRFKGTLAISPRREPFTTAIQRLEGRTNYPVSRGNFVDHR